MKLFKSVVLPMLLAFGLSAAQAALDIGERAPDFTADAALGGKTFRYSLGEALAKGPVVLYFFPAAFTEGCSIEAHEFAEAIDQYKALGASVVGVSGDDLELIGRFSAQVCQSRFPVVADDKRQVIKAFDAAMRKRPEYADRVSYVIAPDGKVVYTYMSLNPHQHVERTLAAVQQWVKAQPGR